MGVTYNDHNISSLRCPGEMLIEKCCGLGTNGGKMVVRRGGTRFEYLTLDLDPAGDAALQYSRYPVSESGMIDMVRKLVDVGTADMQYGECDVQIFDDVKVDGRSQVCAGCAPLSTLSVSLSYREDFYYERRSDSSSVCSVRLAGR